MEVDTTTESDLSSMVPKLMTYLNPQVLFEDKGIIALPSFNVSAYFNGTGLSQNRLPGGHSRHRSI